MKCSYTFTQEEFDEFKRRVRDESVNEGFWRAVRELHHCLIYKSTARFGDMVSKEQREMWNKIESKLLKE